MDDDVLMGDDVAYVPSMRLRPDDVEATLELRRTVDGALGVLVYSSLESLVAGCGPAQPWVAVPTGRVADLIGLAGADVVVWDAEISSAARHVPGGTD